MTILDRSPGPGVADGAAVLAEVPGPNEFEEIAVRLPEQDWCADCVLDEGDEPGMPRDVLSRSVEQEASLPGTGNPIGERAPLSELTRLSCGHTIVELPAPRWPSPLS